MYIKTLGGKSTVSAFLCSKAKIKMQIGGASPAVEEETSETKAEKTEKTK